MDAFERWWQWAQKPLDSPLTIPAEIHHAVTSFAPRPARPHQGQRCARRPKQTNEILNLRSTSVCRMGRAKRNPSSLSNAGR
jgi:hypothetical protein